MTGRLERICRERGMRMSEQRRVIFQILDATKDHPSAEDVHHRASQADPGISLATVYRTLNILTEAGILNRVGLGDRKAHYEKAGGARHEHLIDIETGKALEFSDDAIEALLRETASRLGYRLLHYKLELFAAAEAKAVSFAERQARERDARGAFEPDLRPAKRRHKADAAGAG